MKIDETNLAIIQHLRDGRKSYKQIADDLGLTENTVRSRVKKLLDCDLLDITGRVDPEAISRHQLVIIGVKLGTENMFEKAEAFSRLKGVVSVAIVTGRYDLMATVLFREGFDLQDFYTDEVVKVKGVKSMETFVVYKGFNVKVPYVL
ncbi:MAG: Lrp/AsnC family transcriptional regulator [Thermodesulfobacteriota bacterium]